MYQSIPNRVIMVPTIMSFLLVKMSGIMAVFDQPARHQVLVQVNRMLVEHSAIDDSRYFLIEALQFLVLFGHPQLVHIPWQNEHIL